MDYRILVDFMETKNCKWFKFLYLLPSIKIPDYHVQKGAGGKWPVGVRFLARGGSRLTEGRARPACRPGDVFTMVYSGNQARRSTEQTLQPEHSHQNYTPGCDHIIYGMTFTPTCPWLCRGCWPKVNRIFKKRWPEQTLYFIPVGRVFFLSFKICKNIHPFFTVILKLKI